MSYIDIDILSSQDLQFNTSTDFDGNINPISLNVGGQLNLNSNSAFLSSLTFNANTLQIDGANLNVTSSAVYIQANNIITVLGGNVGINNTNPTNKFDIFGSASFSNPAFLNNSGQTIGSITNGWRFTIGKNFSPSFDGYFFVSGTIRVGPTDNEFFCDTVNQKVMIGDTDFPTSAKLLIRGTTLNCNTVSDSSILISSVYGPPVLNNKMGLWQFVSKYDFTAESLVNWNNYTQGILFSVRDVSNVNNNHWLVSPAFDGTGTIVNSGETCILFFCSGQGSALGTFFNNNLYFCYLTGSQANPVNTMTTDYSKAMAWITTPGGNSGPTADTIDFTGQHRSLPSENDFNFYDDKVGQIVISDGVYCQTMEPDDFDTTISINEAIPKVKLSNQRNDKRVFGVLSWPENNKVSNRSFSVGNWISNMDIKIDDHRLIINSLGEGGIIVCNINGNLENGDYITSCEIPGFGMKQDAPNLKNYTVAKITCDCDFNLSSSLYKCEEFEFSGSIYRKAFVGCTYHCG